MEFTAGKGPEGKLLGGAIRIAQAGKPSVPSSILTSATPQSSTGDPTTSSTSSPSFALCREAVGTAGLFMDLANPSTKIKELLRPGKAGIQDKAALEGTATPSLCCASSCEGQSITVSLVWNSAFCHVSCWKPNPPLPRASMSLPGQRVRALLRRSRAIMFFAHVINSQLTQPAQHQDL